MKLTLAFLIFMILPSCKAAETKSPNIVEDQGVKTEMKTKQPVLVELFTSEGCSSCPPADRALTFLKNEQPNQEVEIVTLALHVTYWDDLGWKDRFSSPLFTRRQELYNQKFKLDSIYTPQMIIDGSYELVGSDLTKAQKLIAEAAKNKKANIGITSDEDKLKIKISDIPEHKDASIYIAIVENNLLSNVEHGENSGKKLEHNSVARELIAIGQLASIDDKYDSEYVLQNYSEWKQKNAKYIIFLQENLSRKVLGLRSF